MQQTHDDGGLSSQMHASQGAEGASLDSPEGAARFAALVRCSVEEAHQWLRGTTGSMETALDSYLAQKTAAKRPKTGTESSPSYRLPRGTLYTPETACLSEPSARIPPSRGLPSQSTNGKTRSKSPFGKNSSGSEAAAAPVLLIDLAEDSDHDSTLEGDSAVATSHHAAWDEKEDKKGSLDADGFVEGPSRPALEQLPEDFTFFLGECVASGTVTSGTITRLSLTDPLSLMVEVRVPYVQRAGPQQAFRKSKPANSGYRIIYVHLDDPLLLQQQAHLGQRGRRTQAISGASTCASKTLQAFQQTKGSTSSKGCSALLGLDFCSLLASISEQTIFLRLLIDGREAVRLDRHVANSLATLLLLGAIKVDVSWLPNRLPPRRLAVNSTLSVRLAVHVTLQALRLSALRQKGDPLLSQIHFPVLMGQSFSSLVQLMALQPVSGSASKRDGGQGSPEAAKQDDAELRQRLEAIKRCTALASRDETEEETARGPKARLSGVLGDDGANTPGGNCSECDEVQEEALENSGVFCQLVLEEGPFLEHSQSHQRRQRQMGLLFPPSTVFRSRLRRYQAQGLWWMLQCESERSFFLDDEHEPFASLWTMYRLPKQIASCLRDGGLSEDQRSALSRLRQTDAPFAPTHFYLNVSAGLISISKPCQTGRVKGGILADSMGLGKTVQVLALIAVSAVQNRDPKAAASWRSETSGGGAHGVRPSAQLAEGKAAFSCPCTPPEAAATRLDVPSLLTLDNQDTCSPTSPVSISSGSEPADMQPENVVSPSGHSGLASFRAKADITRWMAPDPRAVQRELKRDEDGLFPGGTLVVVPLSLVGQWQAEVETHLGRGVATTVQYYGPSRPRDPRLLAAHTLVLTTYQTLASDFKHLLKLARSDPEVGGAHRLPARSSGVPLDSALCPLASIRFRRVVLDEGHIIKNTNSLVNRSCNALKADARWILTGTPLQNDLSDAFALVEFLRVSPMGSRRWWRAKVSQPMDRGMIRAAVETVRSTLRPLMLRRHGSDLGDDGKPLLPLPPLTVHTFTLQLTYEERLFYQTVFEQSKAKFDQLLQSGQVLQQYTHVLQLLLRLRQACNHPQLLSYRNDMRRQHVAEGDPFQETLCSDPSEAADSRMSYLSLPQTGAADPLLSKLLQDAANGKLGDCPICREPLTEAAVLTTCWHPLCPPCSLRQQSISREIGASCPTCGAKFFPQHVRLLPVPALRGLPRWRQLVLQKHRALTASAACTKTVVSSENVRLPLHPAAQEAKVGSFLSTPQSAAADRLSEKVEGLAQKAGEPFQDIPGNSFFFSTKIRLLLALLETDVLAKRSCVVFSQWTSMLDILEMAFERVEAARSSYPQAPQVMAQDDDAVAELEALPAMRDSGYRGAYNRQREEATQDRNSGRVSFASKFPPQAQTSRLYNYRRIDGTVALEARQDTIRWFMSSTAAPASPGHTPSAQDEPGPFLGQFSLKPFSCTIPVPKDPREAGLPSSHAASLRPPFSSSHEEKGQVSGELGKILLLSLKTGNVGLNLVKATRCYLLDGWWNPQVEIQAMRRLWRYGQDQPVSVFRFVCFRTVEERLEELLEWKGRLSRNALRPDGDFEQTSEGGVARGVVEDKRKGRVSLQDLKKLFEGWGGDADNASA